MSAAATGDAVDRAPNRAAVAAAVVGSAGLAGFLAIHLAFSLLSLTAVVLGVIGARRVRRGSHGRAWATAGYVTGALGVTLAVLLLIGYWVAAATES